jgi:hypothetical protein
LSTFTLARSLLDQQYSGALRSAAKPLVAPRNWVGGARR